jgi:Spy/CpxP family protein refolding chaperone
MNNSYRRSIIAGAAALALLPCASLAQDSNNQQSDRPPQAQQGQQPQRRLAVLAQRLNLTRQQKQQWAQINRETTQKVWAVRKDDSINEAQMQIQLRRIHKEQKEQVLALLTPEQQDALKAFNEEQKRKQQNQGSESDSSSGNSSTQNGNNSNDQDDDLFAGMVSDDPPASQPAPTKKPASK